MADVTDPAAIKFANDTIRPLAEQARALKARITDATNTWFAGMNAKFPNDASNVVDGRTAEGVTELTGADVNSVMGDLIGAAGQLNDQIIGKPCVRPLQVSNPIT